MGLTIMRDKTISNPAIMAKMKANMDLRSDICKAKVGYGFYFLISINRRHLEILKLF